MVIYQPTIEATEDSQLSGFVDSFNDTLDQICILLNFWVNTDGTSTHNVKTSLNHSDIHEGFSGMSQLYRSICGKSHLRRVHSSSHETFDKTHEEGSSYFNDVTNQGDISNAL